MSRKQLALFLAASEPPDPLHVIAVQCYLMKYKLAQAEKLSMRVTTGVTIIRLFYSLYQQLTKVFDL